MILGCPKCKGAIEISADSPLTFQCPSCGEAIDVSRLHESTCPICCSEFNPDDTLVICQDCKTLYHSECWDENHGCSTYGCPSTQHLQTHTVQQTPLPEVAGGAADAAMAGGAADGFSEGMVPCPFCQGLHAATDLVCPACGHLLREDAVNQGGMLGAVRTFAGEYGPRLVRNFKLLWNDVRHVAALAWNAFSQYADFKGTTSRGEYLAFAGILAAITKLLFILDARSVVYWIICPVCLVPTLAITVRRLRDTDLSPWLIFAIPILPLLVLVPSIKKSEKTEVSA